MASVEGLANPLKFQNLETLQNLDFFQLEAWPELTSDPHHAMVM
jgi:hypothetical protein